MNEIENANALCTDFDRAKALACVLKHAEQQLQISPDPRRNLQERIDAVLRRALSGGLEPRRYAALYVVRKAGLRSMESPSSGIYV
jgi:hypothetical protein